jgi:hypothetical protein
VKKNDILPSYFTGSFQNFKITIKKPVLKPKHLAITVRVKIKNSLFTYKPIVLAILKALFNYLGPQALYTRKNTLKFISEI